MKKYVKSEDVKAGLCRMIARQRRSGNLLLPGIRDLALQYNTCKGTIGKVLAELKESGVIYSEKQSNRIAPPRRQKLRYCYVFTGHLDNGRHVFQAYRRLWEQLERAAEFEGWEIVPILFDPTAGNAHRHKTAQAVSEYDAVFLSLVSPELQQEILAVGKMVFLLDESDYAPADNLFLLTLDNEAAGSTAARLLAEASYRRTLMIARATETNIPFSKRIRGARKVFESYGMESDLMMIQTASCLHDVIRLNRGLHDRIQRGFDSAFFLSDEFFDLICDEFFMEGMIPERFGIVAVDGTHSAAEHAPPATVVSVATSNLCTELIRIIRNLEGGTFRFSPGGVYLAPKVYPGCTLRKNGVPGGGKE